MTAEGSAHFARLFLNNKDYKIDRSIFKTAPPEFDIQKQTCEMLFCGFNPDGKAEMWYADKKDVTQVVKRSRQDKQPDDIETLETVIMFGSGSLFARKALSAADEYSFAHGNETTDAYHQKILKYFRKAALDQHTGGLAQVIQTSCGM